MQPGEALVVPGGTQVGLKPFERLHLRIGAPHELVHSF